MNHPARQAGLSLIELMISLVLGLIIISALFNVYSGSSRSARFTEGLQRMQENGRFGIGVMQRSIRMAGYSTDVPIAPFDLASGDATTLVVRQRAATDCNGEPTVAPLGLAVNTWRLDTTRNEITCTGSKAGATPMPVVEGVEGLRILYGVDSDGDDVPEQYLPHDVNMNPNDVASVRVALLVSSVTPIRSRDSTRSYTLLDEEMAFDDKQARHVFTTTVKLRNRQ